MILGCNGASQVHGPERRLPLSRSDIFVIPNGHVLAKYTCPFSRSDCDESSDDDDDVVALLPSLDKQLYSFL